MVGVPNLPMNKNIIILGVASLLLLTIGLFANSWLYHDRYNLVSVIEEEVQSCSSDKQCELMFVHCGLNVLMAISSNNSARYATLFKRHCAENPPRDFVDFVEGYGYARCLNNICVATNK
jgi:hypothetical protein